MGLCFICNEELNDNCIRLSTTYTPRGNASLSEKIAYLLGEPFMIIVNNDDYVCKKCASSLNQIDNLEIDLKLIKNSILSCLRKKRGVLVNVLDVEAIKMNKDNSKDDHLSKISHPLKLTEHPNGIIQQKKRPIEFLNIRHNSQQASEVEQLPMAQQVLTPQCVSSSQQILGKRLRVILPQQVLTPQQVPSLQQIPREQILGKKLRVSLPQQVLITQQQVPSLQQVPREQILGNPLRLSLPQQVLTPQRVSSSEQMSKEQFLEKQLRISLPKQEMQQIPKRIPELNPQLLPNQPQYSANALIIHKLDTHVQKYSTSQSNKIEPEKPIFDQNADKILTPITEKKNIICICKKCAKRFDTHGRYIKRTQKHQKKQTLNKFARTKKKISPSTSNIIKLIPQSEFRTINQNVESPIDDNQQDNKRDTINIYMPLNNNYVPDVNFGQEGIYESTGEGEETKTRSN